MTLNKKTNELLENCIRILLYGGANLRCEAIAKACQCFELICKSMIQNQKHSLSKIVAQLEQENISAIIENKEIIGEIRKLRNCHIHDIKEICVDSSMLKNALRVVLELINGHQVEIENYIGETLIKELKNKLNGDTDKEVTAVTNLKKHYYQTHNIDFVRNDTFENNFTEEKCPKCGKWFLYIEDQFVNTELPYCFYCQENIDAIECGECPSYKLSSQKCSSCGTE